MRVKVRFGLSALLICGLPALSACAGGGGSTIPSNIVLSAPDAPAIVPLEQGYRIAPLDTVTVKVFKLPDLSGDYAVDLAGQISMPLIGEVEAFNLTTGELDERLTNKLGEKYLQHPDVSVGIKSSTRRSVTVDGAVKSPGSFPLVGSVTLLQAVAQAGGLADDGNAHKIAVFRQISGKRQAASFDLGKIRKGQADDPPIYAGDIIVVDGSAIKKLQKSILNGLPILSIFKPF